jgi:hypothetical protein
MQKLKHFKIGHGAYGGANALTYVTSKASAVRELRQRGVLRNEARDAIKRVCNSVGDYGYVTVTGSFDTIELAAV